MHGAGLFRWCGQGSSRFVNTLRHVVDALLNDAKALPHLFNPHHRPVITISMLASRNVEVELLITGIWLLLAEIPSEAGRAQIGAGNAPLDSLVSRETAYVLGARLENPVAQHHAVILTQAGWKVVEKIAEHLFPAARQVLCYAADAKPVGMHARSGYGFHNRQSAFAIVEGEEDRRHLSEVLRECPVPDQVTDDAKQFHHHDPDHLRARRDFYSRKPLHGVEVSEIVHYPAQVIDAIAINDVSVPTLALAHFLGAAVMEADFGNCIHNHLAVKLKHNPQHAVSSRMLWAHVEKDKVFIVAGALHSPFLWTEAQCFLLSLLFFLR